MPRLRVYDMRLSSLPECVGLCTGDIPGLCNVLNEAELSLLHCKEVSDEGWHGTWAEIQFTASRCSPEVILPREVCRLEQIDVCGRPIATQNQFFEYLRFGNGRMRFGPDGCHRRACRPTTAYARNNSPTKVPLFPPPQKLSVYITDPADVGKRILLQGEDNTGQVIYSQDVLNQVTGIFLTFAQPFVTAPMQFNRITGIQKDITNGPVQIFQVDPVTGAQVLLLQMEPTEQTAWYRRYHLDPLPFNCCNQPSRNPAENIVQLTALAALEHIDVMVDTDYLLIQEKMALIREAQANRMAKNDSPASQAQAREYHLQAVRLLIGESSRYNGIENTAIQFKPFGSATLARAGVGLIR